MVLHSRGTLVGPAVKDVVSWQDGLAAVLCSFHNNRVAIHVNRIVVHCLGLLLLVPILSGCDASGPDENGVRQALVGTWMRAGRSAATYLTASISQQIIDPNAPGEGAIRLTGDVEAKLSYLWPSHHSPYSTIVASDTSLKAIFRPGRTQKTIRLKIEPTSTPRNITLYIGTEAYVYRRGDFIYDYDEQAGTLLILDEVVFSNAVGMITANGTLTSGHQVLRADEETLVFRLPAECPCLQEILTLRDDGTYTVSWVDARGPQTTNGTWRVEGEMLVFDYAEKAGEGRTAFEVMDDHLVLKSVGEAGQDEEEELAKYEVMYGVETGTLIDVERRFGIHYSTSSSKTSVTSRSAVDTIFPFELHFWGR